jgi:polyisoprenyl-teichoic acid--peptidoglycan teichoic acid transferase
VSDKRRSPLWAKLLVTGGVLLLLTSGTAFAALERYEGGIDTRNLFGDLNPGDERPPEITGPLNVLLVGLDTRPSRPNEVPLADAIIIVHLTEDLSAGYLISLPRDTVVDIPPYERTGFPGRRDRLNAAMSYGARQQPGETMPDVARGFELLSRTVSDLTGITHFHAGAVINFTGFRDIVDAMDGISVVLDEMIVSLHRRPDGRHREVIIGGEGYLGPQMVYQPGSPPCGPARADGSFRCELNGWQALDVARQRYGVEGGDYGRQRNQQLILRAIMEKALSRDILTNPVALDRVLRSSGESLIFDGRGHRPLGFALALRDLRPGDLVMVQVDAGSLGGPANYRGEELRPRTYELFAALREGRVDDFLLANRDFVG